MTAGLHDISVAIGALQAQATESAAQTSKLFERLDALGQQLTGIASLKDRVDRIEPLVDTHEQANQLGKGMVVGWSAATGGGVATLGYAILRKLGVIS